MVIQRWQSVLLLIAALCMGFFTFMSLGQVQLADYTLNFTTFGFSYEGTAVGGAPTGFMTRTWGFFIIALLSCLIPLINIFMFKNLQLQKRLCMIEILFLIAVIATGAIYAYTGVDNGAVSWSSLVVAPFIALMADVLAFNRISADERLLKSADRLR
ncbi:MAG: DUF4293 domain-containing protein [Muribaculaceae bacterium]|nr:DUF4293 domain-containing protein [Muribaculaceae bacterium]